MKPRRDDSGRAFPGAIADWKYEIIRNKCEMPIDEFVADLMEHTPRDYYEYLD